MANTYMWQLLSCRGFKSFLRGIICTLIPGLGWFISFSMLIVCVRYVKLPKHIAQNTEMGRILSSECTTYKKDGDTDA